MPKVPKAARGKVVHPNSRAAAQLARQGHREQRMDKRLKTKGMKYEVLGDKLSWFQEHLDPDKKLYTKDEARHLIEEYLGRFEDELEQIDIVHSLKGRSGQQHASRLHTIQVTKERERQEYINPGMEVPDILNAKQLQTFREWNGEMRFVQNIKMKKIKAEDEEKKKEVTSKTSEKMVTGEGELSTEAKKAENISLTKPESSKNSVEISDKNTETMQTE